MELRDAVFTRRMTRAFAPRAIDGETLDRLIESAVRAPSAGATYGVDLLIVTSGAQRARFWEAISDEAWRCDAARSGGLLAAPVVVVPVADPAAYEERYRREDKRSSSLAERPAAAWPVPYWTVDASFVVMSLLLATTDAHLGALFFQLQGREAELCAAFAIPAGRTLIGAVAIGQPREGASDTDEGRARTVRDAPDGRRRPVSEVVHRDRW